MCGIVLNNENMSASEIQTALSAASTAQLAGDYATALKHLRSAQILLIGLPNSAKNGASMQWDRNAIQSTIDTLERKLNASTGFQVTKTRWKRASE